MVKPNTGMKQHEEPEDEAPEESGGQVSEVSGMAAAGAGEPIMPDQATAGAPDAESGEVQEGGVGPNARPRDDTRDE